MISATDEKIFTGTVERVKKTKVSMRWIEKHEPLSEVRCSFLTPSSNGETMIGVDPKCDLKSGDRIFVNGIVFDVRNISLSDNEKTASCTKNDFESSWKKFEKMGKFVQYGYVKAIHRDDQTDKFMDAWVGLYIKNLLEHYEEVKGGKHIGDIYRMCEHDVPSVIVGAGPSLDKNVSLLRQFPGLIICADRAYKTLLANGVEPDIVLSVDCHIDLVADMLDCSKSKDHLLVLNSCSDPRITKVWKGRILWYNMRHPGVQFTDRVLPAILPKFHGLENVGCVGNTGIVLSDFMSLSPVVLVGQDFGYTDGRMHCTEYEEKDGRFIPTETDHAEKLKNRTGKVEVNGVVTYIGFRNYMETVYLLREKKKINILNCTEGGILKRLPNSRFSDTIGELEKKSNRRYVEVKKILRNM